MTEKTLKNSVREKSSHFAEIYAEFKKQLEQRQYDNQSSWEYLFAVPFGSVHESRSDEAKKHLGVPSSHHAAEKVVSELGLDKLRLGPYFKNDLRVSAGLEVGILTLDQVAPPSPDQSTDFDRLIERLPTDCSDPVFWRTLLEVFCRSFVSTQGTGPWTLHSYIELAFDLDEIRRGLPGGVWNSAEARRRLGRTPYSERYSKIGIDVIGEDRIRRVTKILVRMDDEALERLKALFPNEYFEVADIRFAREAMERHGAIGLLDIGEHVGDALTPKNDAANGE